MISYVVPLWRDEHYAKVCRPALEHQVREYGAEIIETRSTTSIFAACEVGRQQATNPMVCYLHDDVQIVDPDATERIIEAFMRTEASLVGVVGSAEGETKCPWWTNDRRVGGWIWANRNGDFLYQDAHLWPTSCPEFDGQRPERANVRAHLLDGILMCERAELRETPWNDLDGFHGYDVDRCMQAHQFEGVAVADLVVAHISGEKTPEVREHFDRDFEPRMALMREAWGLG